MLGRTETCMLSSVRKKICARLQKVRLKCRCTYRDALWRHIHSQSGIVKFQNEKKGYGYHSNLIDSRQCDLCHENTALFIVFNSCSIFLQSLKKVLGRFNYRLITAYLLLRVNLDKMMHVRWDFDASSARTRRVSALDKHQNWSASALFCLNFRAQSKCAVVGLIHTRRKQTFFVFYYVIKT